MQALASRAQMHYCYIHWASRFSLFIKHGHDNNCSTRAVLAPTSCTCNCVKPHLGSFFFLFFSFSKIYKGLDLSMVVSITHTVLSSWSIQCRTHRRLGWRWWWRRKSCLNPTANTLSIRVEAKRTVPLSYLRKLSWRAYNKRLQAKRYPRRCDAWVVGWSTDKWVAVKKPAPRSQSKTRDIDWKRISKWSSNAWGAWECVVG